jgi:hypothetical protein
MRLSQLSAETISFVNTAKRDDLPGDERGLLNHLAGRETGDKTMAFVAHPTDFQADVSLHRAPASAFPGEVGAGSSSGSAKKQTATKRPGFLRRLYDTIMENRQRSANRDIEAFLARRGHRLTDSIERDLNMHLFNGGWHARR